MERGSIARATGLTDEPFMNLLAAIVTQAQKEARGKCLSDVRDYGEKQQIIQGAQSFLAQFLSN